MDKINKNRHRKEGWEGIEGGGEDLSRHLAHFRFFILLSGRIIVDFFFCYTLPCFFVNFWGTELALSFALLFIVICLFIYLFIYFIFTFMDFL